MQKKKKKNADERVLSEIIQVRDKTCPLDYQNVHSCIITTKACNVQ